MQRSGSRLAILVLGLLLFGACNSLNLFQSTDDKAITTDVQAKLFNDPVLKSRDIHVDAQNGIVTLSGVVETDLERAAVERIATQESGVKKVVDLLAVASTASLPAPQVAESTPTAAPPAREPARERDMAASQPVLIHRHKPADTRQAPAAPVTPPAPPPSAQHDQPGNSQNNASAALEAYTNSVAQQGSDKSNSAPAPASTSTPAAAAVPPGSAAAVAASSQMAAAPAAPALKPQEHLTIPAGTVVTIRMVDNIDSSRNKAGEEFAATLDSPIAVGDRTLGAHGADARVRLVDAKSAGSLSGQSELQLELISVTINGVPYSTQSGYYEQHGASRGTRTAETVGGGAVLGALLGGLLGHGRGAAIGSVAGAGAGTAVQVSTKGQQVKVPSETKLDFTLKQAVDVSLSAG